MFFVDMGSLVNIGEVVQKRPVSRRGRLIDESNKPPVTVGMCLTGRGVALEINRALILIPLTLILVIINKCCFIV